MRSLQDQSGWCGKAQWTLAGVLALLAIAGYLGVYRPTQGRLDDLRLQIDAKRRQLDADQARARQLPDVALRVDKLRLRLERFDRKLPRRDDLGEFIRVVSQISQQSALRKFIYQPSVARRTEQYCEMPVLLSFEGDFAGVAAFLRQTEQMERLTRVRHLRMKTIDAKLGTVEVEMTINIYYMDGA